VHLVGVRCEYQAFLASKKKRSWKNGYKIERNVNTTVGKNVKKIFVFFIFFFFSVAGLLVFVFIRELLQVSTIIISKSHSLVLAL
jgi:hypothetical protein